VPQFILGRIGYDNWLVDHAVSNADVAVIDVTATVAAAHINHDSDPRASHKRARTQAENHANILLSGDRT
jgi:hypothetical protein